MLQSLSCLLIDDDIEDQEIFLIALSDVDAEVKFITANDGPQALRLLEDSDTFKPDFIFLDMNLPGMTCEECLMKIKQMPHLHSVPIIIYTTSKSDKHREEILRLGATHFYSKPTSITELTVALNAIFQGKFV